MHVECFHVVPLSNGICVRDAVEVEGVLRVRETVAMERGGGSVIPWECTESTERYREYGRGIACMLLAGEPVFSHSRHAS